MRSTVSTFLYAIYIATFIMFLVFDIEFREENWFYREENRESARRKGWILFGFSTYCAFWILVCSIRAAYTHPGMVPDETNWNM